MAPTTRALPSKEASLFKELLTLYETRQLKKGLKTADQILKKFPEHGETLCMKGLLLTHMGKRDEGIDLVKKGVRLDLTSHICWHVFGLIQKGEKNYEEALKSYMQALRFDKDNLNILRDAAQLQTHLRIYDGLVETRHTLLRLRPALRQHWIALAVAYHLNGNLVDAKNILEHYERTLKNVPDYDVEHSETMLYHVHLLEELGESSEALALLDVNAKSRVIVDRTAIMETRARLLSKLGSNEVEHAWRALIEHNPDCYDYYRGYLSSQGINLVDDLTSEDRSKALQILRDLSTQITRTSTPRHLALTIAVGDDFSGLVRLYLLSGLKRGIPSLFTEIKDLYRDPSKQQVIEDIVEAARGEYAPDSSTESSQPTSADPTIYLWILYYLAQHYSFIHRPAHALSIIDLALSHTPTLPELYTCKARILKRGGDLLGAARCIDEARLLDGQDRFLNTKSAKYRLRAGLIDEASEILGLFTKKDAPSPGTDLEDMQSLLYLMEEGDAQFRNGKLNLALKKYVAIQKIFNEIEDDQYDFHGYSLRKFTLNIYFNLLKWENQLRSHPAYVTATLSAARIFVAVHDDPSIITVSASTAQLTDAEKKAKKKARKAAQKVQEDFKKTHPLSMNEDKGLELSPSKDDDPDGSKLLQAPNGLERAAKMLSPLSTLASTNVEVWIVIYDVAIRRKKFLQAIKAVNHALSLDPEHPELHIRKVHLHRIMTSLPETPPPIGPLLAESLSKIIPDELSYETFNSQYLQRHSTSPTATLASAKVLQDLQAPREEVEAVVFTTLNPDSRLDIKTALKIISFLTTIKSPRIDEFRKACNNKFELSTVFKSPEELAVLNKNVTEGAVVAEEVEIVS